MRINLNPFVEIPLTSDPKARKPETLTPAVPDPVSDALRARFTAMRQLAREEEIGPRFDYNAAFYNRDQRVRSSRAFYKQAVFMADFEDDYTPQVPFNDYFPLYQMMSFAQLRTYFTWRARVRRGEVRQIGLSYAFVYVYELLNQIGVADPAAGLRALLDFWYAYRELNNGLDKHLINWLKDYHLYYALPQPFRDFIVEQGLGEHYPDPYTTDYTQGADLFEMYRVIANFNLNTRYCLYRDEETQAVLRDGLCTVVAKLREALLGRDEHLDSLLFGPPVKVKPWQPFNQALFLPGTNRPESLVILSLDEIYVCHHDRWSCRTAHQCNRKLMRYLFKKTEALSREILKYKHRLAPARLSDVDNATLVAMQVSDVKLDAFIGETLCAFIAARQRIEVTVRPHALVKIRQEALDVQKKLLVDEFIPLPAEPNPEDEPAAPAEDAPAIPADSPWADFAASLTKTERGALAAVLAGRGLSAYAASVKQMPEVLLDGINQKALAAAGDTLMELDAVYTEYLSTIKEVMRDG